MDRRPTDDERSETRMKNGWNRRAEREARREQARQQRQRLRECLRFWGLSEPDERAAP